MVLQAVSLAVGVSSTALARPLTGFSTCISGGDWVAIQIPALGTSATALWPATIILRLTEYAFAAAARSATHTTPAHPEGFENRLLDTPPLRIGRVFFLIRSSVRCYLSHGLVTVYTLIHQIISTFMIRIPSDSFSSRSLFFVPPPLAPLLAPPPPAPPMPFLERRPPLIELKVGGDFLPSAAPMPSSSSSSKSLVSSSVCECVVNSYVKCTVMGLQNTHMFG